MKLRFRLWHLFALTALAALFVFVADNLGVMFDWEPETPKTMRHLWINVRWNGEEVFNYDSWPPPDPPPPPRGSPIYNGPA